MGVGGPTTLSTLETYPYDRENFGMDEYIRL